MVRYLIVRRNADCRQVDRWGYPPMHWAAMYGHLEIIKLLSHDGGAHDDIRKVNNFGYSPLRVALSRRHFHVARWLILNGALASRDDNVIDDIVMRRDLRQSRAWDEDRRLAILAWARDAVTTHDTVKVLLLTGTMVPTSVFRRHPNNPYATRSNKRRRKSSSPLVMLKGKSGILELIARYVSGTKQQLRTLRRFNVLLPVFIEDTPFAEEDEDEDEDDFFFVEVEDEDEDDY